jgi:hypothetical protein
MHTFDSHYPGSNGHCKHAPVLIEDFQRTRDRRGE